MAAGSPADLDSALPRAARRALTGALLASLGIALLWLCIVGLDVPLFQWFRTVELPGDVGKAIMLSEAFAHGLSVAMLLVILGVIDPDARRRVGVVAVCAFGSGALASLMKRCVPRLRPPYSQESMNSGLDSFPSASWWFVGAPEQMPSGLVELVAREPDALHSFPSAHAATAVGLAWGLTWYFRRGGGLFFLLATLAAVQRFVCAAHWPSDILAGGMLASVLSIVVLRIFGSAGTRTRFPRSQSREVVSLARSRSVGELNDLIPGAGQQLKEGLRIDRIGEKSHRTIHHPHQKSSGSPTDHCEERILGIDR